MHIKKFTFNVADKPIELEIGHFAQQATSAVTARMGDTVVLATVMMSKSRDDISWFPLQVEYQEKLYAGGKIKGSRWVKRDGRPSDDVILKARLIDRTIRPLFPDGFKNEVQIIVTVLSADGENDADIPAMFAVSAGLAMSEIPWAGPVGAVRMGYNKAENKLLINPTYEERDTSDLDLVVSATSDAVVMVEAGANEVSEDTVLEAFTKGHEAIKNALTELHTFIDANKKTKIEFTPQTTDEELLSKVKSDLGQETITEYVRSWARLERVDKSEVIANLFEKYEEVYSKGDIAGAIDALMKKEARRQTVDEGTRPDGRKTDEVRPIECEVGLLPRTHGSAMFKRGQTQALTITTLGSPALNQLIESMEGEEEKRYIHHYNMPPFSVGETGRVGWPGRREIGHGALAERAVEPMIPSEEDFPYTIHVVSEILSSNGSTSMASVCGSTLSLMDAGVPLKRPVSGIAMGLLYENDEYVVLSDIQGLEDHTGDMDFKVAGTTEGITAMQMDIKISGIPLEVLKRALTQAQVGRMHILDKMLQALNQPRTQISQFAPKIETLSVPVDRIGEIIGPGGKIIKGIISETGAQVDINDDGRVFITSTDEEAIQKAKTWISNILREIVAGDEFDGEVVRVENYGAFVNLLPGKDGLLHVSNMSADFVSDVNTLVKLGDTVHVRVMGVDDQGKVALTTLTPEQEEVKKNSRPQRDDRRDDRSQRRFRPRGR